jgi:hypothetical protein
VNNPLHVKENDEHAPGFLFICLAFFFRSRRVRMPCTAHAFSPERLTNHCQGFRCTFTEICTTFVAVPLSDPLRKRIRQDTELQYVHPATLNFVHRLRKHANTTIYRCIALLQLLYRWQYQSRKVWTPPPLVFFSAVLNICIIRCLISNDRQLHASYVILITNMENFMFTC